MNLVWATLTVTVLCLYQAYGSLQESSRFLTFIYHDQGKWSDVINQDHIQDAAFTSSYVKSPRPEKYWDKHTHGGGIWSVSWNSNCSPAQHWALAALGGQTISKLCLWTVTSKNYLCTFPGPGVATHPMLDCNLGQPHCSSSIVMYKDFSIFKKLKKKKTQKTQQNTTADGEGTAQKCKSKGSKQINKWIFA